MLGEQNGASMFFISLWNFQVGFDYAYGPSKKTSATREGCTMYSAGFRCGRPRFLEQKNFGFFEIYDMSVRTREEGG